MRILIDTDFVEKRLIKGGMADSVLRKVVMDTIVAAKEDLCVTPEYVPVEKKTLDELTSNARNACVPEWTLVKTSWFHRLCTELEIWYGRGTKEGELLRKVGR